MTAVDVEAGEVVEFDVAAAERRADQIDAHLHSIADNYKAVLPLIREAIEQRDDLALGYRSPGDYVSTEFGDALAGLGIEPRRAIVAELTAAGLSTRAIAPIVGTSHKTVVKDQQANSGGTSVPPADDATVTGIDGKRYPTKTTTRESKSTTVEYADDHTDDEADKEPAPPGPIPGENDLDVDGLADRILPDEVNYRPVLSSVIERAGSALRNLDVERAANAIRTADDAEGYRRSLRDMRDRLDQVLKATQPDHLRSVK